MSLVATSNAFERYGIHAADCDWNHTAALTLSVATRQANRVGRLMVFLHPIDRRRINCRFLGQYRAVILGPSRSTILPRGSRSRAEIVTGETQVANVLCVANQKGGVGKTTTALNLAAAMAKADCRTLLVDLDPQCNATSGLGQQPTARHCLVQRTPLRDSLRPTGVPNLVLLPGCRSFQDVTRLAENTDETSMLEQHLTHGFGAFDYVLIDCPPSLGQLTQAALLTSTEVLMPIQCEYFAMEGLTQMIHVIRKIMQTRPGRLEFGGILLTMYNDALELTLEVDTEVREFFGEIVFDTVIPRDIAVSEAPSHGKSVIDYAPRSRGARAYIELCMEVLERE